MLPAEAEPAPAPENPMARVLIVDGDKAVRRVLLESLDADLHEIIEAPSLAEAARMLTSREIDVVLAEARTSGGYAALASAARHADPALSVVLVAASPNDAAALVEGEPGSLEIVPRPFAGEALRAAVARGAERCRIRRENETLKRQLRELREALDQTVPSRNGGGAASGAPRPSNGDGGVESPSRGNGNDHGNGKGHGDGHAFAEWIASLPESLNLRSLEADVEREIVKRALAASSGVAAQAARKLGLSRSDLAYKLRRLGIVREPR